MKAIVFLIFVSVACVLLGQTTTATKPSDFSQIIPIPKETIAISTSGQTWLRIKVQGAMPGTYKPETTVIESDNEPIVVKSGNKWIIKFRPR